MLTVEEYRERVLATIGPLSPLGVPLLQALGCTLAEDVHAAHALPSFDNSSMDGYAVHAADFHGVPVTLRVVDDLPAGANTRPEVPRGCAARIMTGAPIPLGADCVVPVERTDRGTVEVVIDATPAPGDCIRRAGEDLAAGALAVRAGTVLTARSLALIAACDRASVLVIPRPHVVILSTGSELVSPGSGVTFGQVVDSNSTLLAAAALDCGARITCIGPITDDAEAFTEALQAAARDADLLLTSGGVSMGAYDTVKEVLSTRGGVEFMKVAMQPGMPQGHGIVDGTPIITLPGNPVSAYVSFEVFVRPALRRMTARPAEDERMRTAMVTVDLRSPQDKVQFARGHLTGTDTLTVAPVGGQGSHILGGLAEANCLIVIPAGTAAVQAGDSVRVLDLR